MPVLAKGAPVGLAETIDQMIQVLGDSPEDSALGGAGHTDVTAAIPLFSFGAESVQDGFSLEDAEPFGWRSLLVGDDGSQRFADVEQKRDGTFRYSRITSSPFVEQMIVAAGLIEHERSETDAELRIIEAPDLRLAALWIAGEKNEFIPFEGARTEMISEDEFRELVEHRAHELIDSFIEVGESVQEEHGGESMDEQHKGQLAADE